MMIFLFIIPAIPSGLGNFFIPLHIGARDVAFPRLNLASYWVFVAGFLVDHRIAGVARWTRDGPSTRRTRRRPAPR